jgi:hypothetical protein
MIRTLILLAELTSLAGNPPCWFWTLRCCLRRHFNVWGSSVVTQTRTTSAACVGEGFANWRPPASVWMPVGLRGIRGSCVIGYHCPTTAV